MENRNGKKPRPVSLPEMGDCQSEPTFSMKELEDNIKVFKFPRFRKCSSVTMLVKWLEETSKEDNLICCFRALDQQDCLMTPKNQGSDHTASCCSSKDK